MKIKIYKATAILSALSWTSTGILILVSIVNSMVGFFINITMGVVFLLIGCYLFLKLKNGLDVFSLANKLANKLADEAMVQPKAELEEKPTTTAEGFSQKKLFKRFFWLDFIFFFLSAFLGVVILSGTISRVFFEKMAVFG